MSMVSLHVVESIKEQFVRPINKTLKRYSWMQDLVSEENTKLANLRLLQDALHAIETENKAETKAKSVVSKLYDAIGYNLLDFPDRIMNDIIRFLNIYEISRIIFTCQKLFRLFRFHVQDRIRITEKDESYENHLFIICNTSHISQSMRYVIYTQDEDYHFEAIESWRPHHFIHYNKAGLLALLPKEVPKPIISKINLHCCNIESIRCVSLGREICETIITNITNPNLLKRFDFIDCKELNDDTMFRLSEKSAKLESLTIAYNIPLYNDGITDHGFKNVIIRSPNLKFLALGPSRKLTNSVLKHINNYSKQLIGFDLRGCMGFTEEAIIPIIESRQLQSLSLECQMFGMRTVQAIRRHCKTLKSLCLFTCRHIIPDAENRKFEQEIVKISRKAQNLKYFDFNGCLGGVSMENILLNVKDIEALRLSETISDIELNIIAKSCQNLSILGIWESKNITDDGVIKLSESCKKITALEFGSCESITDKILPYLAKNLKYLKTLSLDYNTNITKQNLQKFIKSSPSIQILYLKECSQISGEFCKQMIVLNPQLSINREGNKWIRNNF